MFKALKNCSKSLFVSHMSECNDVIERGFKGEGLLGSLLVVGLDGEKGVSSTGFSMQMTTNSFSTVVSASPEDSDDICLLSFSIRSESMVVPTGEAWANTKREMNILLRLFTDW